MVEEGGAVGTRRRFEADKCSGCEVNETHWAEWERKVFIRPGETRGVREEGRVSELKKLEAQWPLDIG